MGIQIFINSVEETVAVRQITYKEMWLKVRETAWAAQKECAGLREELEAAMVRNNGLRGEEKYWQGVADQRQSELQAAKLEIAKLTTDNKRLIGDNLNQLERIVSLWEMYQTAASKLNAKEAEKTATTIKSVHMQDGSIFAVETNVPPAESFCGHCSDCANPTDERIDELLKRLDKIAGHYGRPYGLPMAHKGTKQLLFDAVRDWVSGK